MNPSEFIENVPALVAVESPEGERVLCLWKGGPLLDLRHANQPALESLDRLLQMTRADIEETLADPGLDALPALNADNFGWRAPVESQEVWAAGVTYRRSREARIQESTVADVYSLVYEADRPELFFKSVGWRVVGNTGRVGIRSDSAWNVPEPELAALCNSAGEIVAYACGNDMSSREIEGANPLYLPQAKIYDRSCAIGPAAVLAWQWSSSPCEIQMAIRRAGEEIFTGSTSTREMVRSVSALAAVLFSSYTLPNGAWLLTGTGVVPPESITCLEGDEVDIRIERLGLLRGTVSSVPHSGAAAPPRLDE